MKNNRHNRKLKFIRTKNHVRKGGILKAAQRVTDELLTESYPDLLNLNAKQEAIRLSKRYKNKMDCVGLIIGTQDDDFYYKTKHILMSFKVSNN